MAPRLLSKRSSLEELHRNFSFAQAKRSSPSEPLPARAEPVALPLRGWWGWAGETPGFDVRVRIVGVRRLGADLIFEIAPLVLRPAIGAGDPDGGAGIDPAVQRLVAFSNLLPFELLEAALGRDGHKMLGDELLHPLGVNTLWKVHKSGRALRSISVRPAFAAPLARRSGLTLVGGLRQPQEAISLGLEGRDSDRPQPRAAADLPASFRRIDEGRASHRRRAIESLDALDGNNLRKSLLACPCIDGRRFETGVDRQFREAQPNAMGVRPCPFSQRRRSKRSHWR